jgi:hypothetical protein
MFGGRWCKSGWNAVGDGRQIYGLNVVWMRGREVLLDLEGTVEEGGMEKLEKCRTSHSQSTVDFDVWIRAGAEWTCTS